MRDSARADDGCSVQKTGKDMQTEHAQLNHRPATSPESHIICSKKVAGQLIAKLMNGCELQDGFLPLYVFAAEKQCVRITIVREQSAKGRLE